MKDLCVYQKEEIRILPTKYGQKFEVFLHPTYSGFFYEEDKAQGMYRAMIQIACWSLEEQGKF